MGGQPISLTRYPGSAAFFFLQRHRLKVLDREVALRMELDALDTKSLRDRPSSRQSQNA